MTVEYPARILGLLENASRADTDPSPEPPATLSKIPAPQSGEFVTLQGGARVNEHDLRAGLEREELYLCYQPKIDLRSGTVMGAEALLRWDHPEHGNIPPTEFIPLAESSGLIGPIGEWVVERACQQLARWHGRFERPFKIWVNLAAASLVDGPRVVEEIEDALARWNIDPHQLGVEVTESTVIQNMARGSAILRELRRLGIEIALDDFGTGYSSLTYLRRLPITWVKIDRSFVSGVGSSLADAAIVEAVIDLAHALGLAVVAEGVENAEQLAELRELGADRVQGYLLSRPVLPSVLEELIDKPWAGASGIVLSRSARDVRTEALPGHGGPRARLLLSALDAVSDAVTVLEAKAPLFDNRVIYLNSAAEELLSVEASHAEGKQFSQVFQVQAPGEFGLSQLENAARASLVSRGEVSLGLVGGEMHPVDVTFTALNDSAGVQTSWLAIFRDLSEKKALAADRARLARAIDRSGTGVALYDQAGRISYASASLEAMLDIPRGGLIGASIENVFVPPLPSALDPARQPAEGQERNSKDAEEASTALLRGVGGKAVPVRFEVVHQVDDEADAHRALLVHDRRAEVKRLEMQQLALEFNRAALAIDPESMADLTGDLFEFCSEAHRLLDCHGVWVNLLDDARGPLLSRIGHGHAGPLEERIPLSDADRSWLRDALNQSDDFWRVEGPGIEAYVAPWLPELGALHPARRSEFLLRCRGQALGVMIVARGTDLAEDEVAFLRQFADTLSNLLDRLRLSVELENSR